MTGKIKILITDDHTLFRQGIHHLLETEKDLKVVGEAHDARDAISKVAALNPNVLLMDINMPGMSSITAAQLIKKSHPNIKILFLTMYDDQEYIVQCLKAEASGYVLKDTPSTQLIAAIREVMQGGQYISPGALKKINIKYTGTKVTPTINIESGYEKLTTREQEVLKLLAEGLSIKEVAVKLNISMKTADVHKSNLMRKLDIHDRAALIKFAIRNKLIRVEL